MGTIEDRRWHFATKIKERLGHKWALEALDALYDAHPRSLRLGDLIRTLGALDQGTVWPTTLRQTLDHLRADGLITREIENPGPVRLGHHSASHAFRITDLGHQLVELLGTLNRWVRENWPEPDADSGNGERNQA